MLQDYLQPAGGDILSWVLCSWHVLNSGFLISWESFRHLISWNILKMQIKMVFFFFMTRCYTFQNCFFIHVHVFRWLENISFWGDWKQWYIFCVWNFILDHIVSVFVAVHGFYFFVSFFFFAPQGTHLNDRVDAANKRAVKILRNQWNLSFYMLNKFCAPRCQIKIMFIKPVC